MRGAVEAAAHLALWAGLYVAGAVVFLAQVTGLDALVSARTRVVAAALALCTATGVYLLDRVKLRDAWLDPADAAAHPARFGFVSSRSVGVRALAVVTLAAAAWCGWRLHPLGVVVPVLAAVGVLVYAGRPRRGRARPKDVVLVKNAYVAAGITAFALLVVLVGSHPGAEWGEMVADARGRGLALGLACVLLGARVFADAALCDLDDEAADREHGTATLATHLGRRRAWGIAMGVRLAIAAALAAIPVFPLHARLAWAAVTVLSSVALRLANPPMVRDWVDARLAIEAAVVSGVLAVAGGVGLD